MRPLSEIATPVAPRPEMKAEFSPEERNLLLQLAHESILSVLEERPLAQMPASPHFDELRGVFTTVYLDGKLRGCVGYPIAIAPLCRAVTETARSAAFEDPRFAPVRLDEARRILVSISILSPLVPIRAEDVQVGRHGLLVSFGLRRGLLLPQVPVEHGWGRTTFLEQTCYKAGLPPNAWREGATLEAFTAEVFSDPGCE